MITVQKEDMVQINKQITDKLQIGSRNLDRYLREQGERIENDQTKQFNLSLSTDLVHALDALLGRSYCTHGRDMKRIISGELWLFERGIILIG